MSPSTNLSQMTGFNRYLFASKKLPWVATCLFKSLIICFTVSVAFSAQAQELLKLDNVFNLNHQQNPQRTILIGENSWMLATPDHLNRCPIPLNCFKEFPAPGIGSFTTSHPYYLIGEQLFLTTPGSGPVYRADPDSITRIDRSFDHQAQKGAAEFLRNDTIWRHGGYAAWSAHNLITYFDTKALEWEVYRPLNGSTLPPALWKHRAILDGDSLWIFGGYEFQPENPKSGKPNKNLWLFDFRNRKWHAAGPIHPELSELEHTGHCLTPIGKGQYFAYLNGVILYLNFRTNLFVTKRTEKQVIHCVQGICPFVQQGQIYYLDHSAAHTANPILGSGFTAILFRDSLERILSVLPTQGQPIAVAVAHESTAYLYIVITLTLSGLMALVFTFKKSRKTRSFKSSEPIKLQLTENGLLYRSTLHPLEPLHIAIIRLLLDSTSEVNTNHIIDLVRNPDLDYTHNLRIKTQIIANINVRIRSILNIAFDPISIAPSSIDRRVRTYKIDKSLFI